MSANCPPLDEIDGSYGVQAANTNLGAPTVPNEPAYGEVVTTRSGPIAGDVRSLGRGEDVLATMRDDIAQGRDVLGRGGHCKLLMQRYYSHLLMVRRTAANPTQGAMNIDPQLGGQSASGKFLIPCLSCSILTTIQAAPPGLRVQGAPGMIIGADPAMTTNVPWNFVGRE